MNLFSESTNRDFPALYAHLRNLIDGQKSLFQIDPWKKTRSRHFRSISLWERSKKKHRSTHNQCTTVLNRVTVNFPPIECPLSTMLHTWENYLSTAKVCCSAKHSFGAQKKAVCWKHWPYPTLPAPPLFALFTSNFLLLRHMCLICSERKFGPKSQQVYSVKKLAMIHTNLAPLMALHRINRPYPILPTPKDKLAQNPNTICQLNNNLASK